MEALSRFDCPSVSLRLNALLKRMRRMLWTALALSIVLHFIATQWRGKQQETQVAKPLTTQFVKRQPRLTKPLELKKRPRPKRRAMQRKMVSVKARVDRGQRVGAFHPTHVLQGLAHPRVTVGRTTSFQDAELEPQAVAQMIEGTKEAKDIVDMSLEMIDIDAMDTGRYRAMVVQDPRDKREIRGYLHLASAYPATAALPDNEIRRWPNIIQALVRAMNKFTNIRTDFQGKLTFDSSELLKLPFLYTRMYWPFRLSDSESNQLGHYLIQGGFLYAESVPPGGPYFPAHEPIKQMIRDALSTQGLQEYDAWSLERLPESHPVYHCYFDFNGPPVGTEYKRAEYKDVDHLDGAIYERRVLAIVSQKNYAHPWCDWHLPHHRKDATRQLQFAVNMIIFSLTQEGSITHQVMNMIY